MVGCWAAFALVTTRVPIKGYEQPMLLRSAHGSSTGGVACGRRPECRRTVAEPALKDHSLSMFNAEGWGVGWRCCAAYARLRVFLQGESVMLLGVMSGFLQGSQSLSKAWVCCPGV